MVPHLDTLTRLASENRTATELGVRGGVASWALLDGLPPNGWLRGVDIEDVTPVLPERVTADPRFSLLVMDDRHPDLILHLTPCDLVLIDTSHEYHHTLEELRLADRLRARTIVLHDYGLEDVADAVARFLRHAPWVLTAVEESPWGLAVLSHR